MNQKNENFANSQEKRNIELLNDFNNFLNLQCLEKCPKGHYVDASGVTKNNQFLNFELKIRNQTLKQKEDGTLYVIGVSEKTNKPYSADTLFIEAHKSSSLFLDYVMLDYLPMYINFLNDDVVVVYNLLKLNKRYEKEHHRIWSELYQSFEIADRELLALEDAFIYKKVNNEYKLIYKPNGERRTKEKVSRVDC